MDSSKIKGTVEMIGNRVTQAEGNLRVEEMVRVTIEPTPEQIKEFEKDPVAMIKRLLTQEGHKFKDVVSPEPMKPVSHLRSAYFHTVYDRANPGDVCHWHRYTY
jgi:hypothetical protein